MQQQFQSSHTPGQDQGGAGQVIASYRPAMQAAPSEQTRSETGLDVEEITTFLAALQRAAQKRKSNYLIANIGSLLSLPAAGLLCAIAVQTKLDPAQMDFGRLSAANLPLDGFAAIMLCYSWRGAKKVTDAVQIVMQTEDLRAAGPLAEALEMNEPRYRRTLIVPSDVPAYEAAVNALTRLLPRLRAGDIALLNRKQRGCLYRALPPCADPKQRRYYNPDFAIALLSAFEVLGDTGARSYVELLARRLPHSEAEVCIVAAAQACLATLQSRELEANAPETLLRGASAPTSTEILLRATAPPSEADAGTALRASLPPAS